MIINTDNGVDNKRNHINKKEIRALINVDCVLKKLLVVNMDSDSVEERQSGQESL